MSKAAHLGILLLTTMTSGAFAVDFRAVDDLGDTVSLMQAPRRIVSLAPSNTELLYALGIGDRIVGVSEFCNYPAAAIGIAKVAGYATVNIERVVAVEPDLVVAARGNPLEQLQLLRGLGIAVFAIDVHSIDKLFEVSQRLGILTGQTVSAGKLIQLLKSRVRAVEEKLQGVVARPRVMWGHWSEPIYTAGEGSCIHDVLERAGGINVSAEAIGMWPQVGIESIVSWAPEVIVTTHLPSDSTLDAEILRLRTMEGWRMLPAVRQGRVHFIEADLLARPGPRMIDALEQVAAILHPIEKKE